MGSIKPRVATYTSEENIRKFKIISSYNNKSMSLYLEYLIEQAILDFENEHGEIEIKDIGISDDNIEENSKDSKNIIIQNVSQNGDQNSINIG